MVTAPIARPVTVSVPLAVTDERHGALDDSTTFIFLTEDNTAYVAPLTFLTEDNTSYTIPKTFLIEDGTSYSL